MILEVAHPRLGVLREVASPVRTAGGVASPAPAPRLGEHTDEILGGLLGYGAARIAALQASGALGPIR
jgi:crotonobetainyl-CoA:carnitine CoA-transferase CaiB-like acyl-CoA transferase